MITKPLDFNITSYLYPEGDIYFQENEMKSIWNNINLNEKIELKDFNIKIKAEEKTYTNIFVKSLKKAINFKIYKIPVNISIEDNTNNLKIYSVEHCREIIDLLLMSKYLIEVDGQKYQKGINLENVNKIKASIIFVEEEEFKEYINRKENIIDMTIGIHNIEKNKLSFYFDEICVHDKEQKTFNLLIDSNRIELMNRIDKFFISENLFYWIIGTDGIGKTITMLVYSSLVKNFKILYLNLKLFNKYDRQKIINIFLNELKRLFLTNENDDQLSSNKYLYELLISNILKEAKGKKETKIKFFWELLFTFLEVYVKLHFSNLDILIIIDQYKTKNYDQDYDELNKLTIKIKNNEILTFKMKLLLVSSINNFDIKKAFLENLFILSFESDSITNNNLYPLFKNNEAPNNNNNLLKNIDKNNKDEDDYELNDIEDNLNKTIENNKRNFENYLNNEFQKENKKDSICFLNQFYSKLTKKEYFNNCCSCEAIIDKNLGSNFRHCIKVFNYSFKYYELLLKEIKETKKKKKIMMIHMKLEYWKHFTKKCLKKLMIIY